MVWSHADRLQLLSIIENRPWHWNKLDFYYTDNDYKENDFAEISKLMKKSTEECQRNWRSMKVCYYRMLRNGKSGKSERTKELAMKSSFLKESFQLITTRPKRRAKSKVNENTECLKLNDSLHKQVNTLNEIKSKSDIENNKPNYNFKNSSNMNNRSKIGSGSLKKSGFNINCESNLRKYRDANNIKQNLDMNFLVYGQMIANILRTMNINIAHDTMHHINNIIYEQQRYNKNISFSDIS